MKKIFGIIASLLVYATVAAPSYADFGLCADNSGSFKFSILCKFGASGTGTNSLNNIIGNIITILLIVAVIIALVFLVIGGIRWITSGGDKTKLDSARGHIVAAIVGLVVALLAYLIINVVLTLLGIGNLQGGVSLPTLTH